MGSRRVLGICCVGYGIGQLLFAIVETLPTIMLLLTFIGILCRWYYGQLSDLYHSCKHNGEQGAIWRYPLPSRPYLRLSAI